MLLRKVLKNISYSIGANLLSFLVSIFMIIAVPKFLPMKDYGMWQLFLFYFSYIGFFHFGWEDGMYLRYAGKTYERLSATIFSGQLYGIFCLQIIIVIIIVLISSWIVVDKSKLYILKCTIVLIPLVNITNGCNQIMQFTNRIKDYAILLILGRLILVGMVFSFLFFGCREYSYMYFSQVCATTGSFVYSIYLCRRLLKPNFVSLNYICSEAWENIKVGSQLMISNIASMLIIGIVRYGISVGWNVTTFGKVSLILSISNFLMIFIGATSIVLFPMLKHIKEDKLASIYIQIRMILSVSLLALLLFYYPMKNILSWWLPQYRDSLLYMVVLFPVCLFESKVQLLINTYLKSMRQETLMLKINVTAVALSVLVTVLSVGYFHNLNMAVFSIIFLYASRCWFAEFWLGQLLHIQLARDMAEEIMMVLIFIISGLLVRSWECMLVYGIAYVIFLVLHRGKIYNLWKKFIYCL